MPKAAHKSLSKSANKKGLTGKRKKAYVYGTLGKMERGKKSKKRPSKKSAY